MELALGNVSKPPFTSASISELKNEVIKPAQSCGLELHRAEDDRNNVLKDFRFMVAFRLADDLEIGIGSNAQVVRVGPGIRMQRLPALHRPKRRWRLPEQMDHPNTASLAPLEDKVLEVLHDQASRGQTIVLSKMEAILFIGHRLARCEPKG